MNFDILRETQITVRELNVYCNPSPIVSKSKYVCVSGARPFSRFFYVTDGKIIFNKGTPRELSAQSGDIVYLPHDITYVSEWETECNGSFITANFIINNKSVVFSSKICIAAHDCAGIYKNLFERLLKARAESAFNSRLRALAIFFELLSALADDVSKSAATSKYGSISNGIAYLENNFWEDFSVETLAKMCNVSPATFRRRFKEYSKFSPITHRNFLRIKRAEELLKSGEYNVTEAAFAVGFYDLCYFNRTFRKFLGINPSELTNFPPR